MLGRTDGRVQAEGSGRETLLYGSMFVHACPSPSRPSFLLSGSNGTETNDQHDPHGCVERLIRV
jgi:hypothetical protein